MIFLPKPNNVQYLSLVDVRSGLSQLKANERSSYLTTFVCQFCRYRYKRLQFEVAPTGDILQRIKGEILKDLPNVFGIAGDILAVEYAAGGKDHDGTL